MMSMPAWTACHDEKKVMLHLISIILTKWMYWLASHAADANGITWPKISCFVSFWCNKSSGATDDTVGIMGHFDTITSSITWPNWYVRHCFSHLEIMNVVVLLSMQLPSLDVDASANSIKWLKNSYCTSFKSFWSNKCHAGITWTNMSYHTSFQAKKWCHWQCH